MPSAIATTWTPATPLATLQPVGDFGMLEISGVTGYLFLFNRISPVIAVGDFGSVPAIWLVQTHTDQYRLTGPGNWVKIVV